VKYKTLHIIPILILLAASCKEPPVINATQEQSNPYKENMINANKVINTAEDTQIKSYIDRHNWDMHQLNNGSWMEEVQVGKGAKVEYEDTINVTYKLESLNGNIIYQEKRTTLIVGQNKPTVGLDRAVMDLHHGSKARLILPSNLGYGVVGDGDKVTSRTVLIYHLTVE